MPLFRPPQVAPETRRAIGAEDFPDRPRLHNQSRQPELPELQRRGLKCLSDLAVSPHPVQGQRSSGRDEVRRKDVTELDALGQARTRSVQTVGLDDSGNQAVLGRPGALRPDTARAAVEGPKSLSSGGLATGKLSGEGVQAKSAGAAQSSGYEYINQGPVIVNGQSIEDWYAQQQLDASLGIGQSTYIPPSSTSFDSYQTSSFEPIPAADYDAPDTFESLGSVEYDDNWRDTFQYNYGGDSYDPAVYQSGQFGGL